MQADEEYENERLDHLGIVAGVCHELGLVKWIDQQVGERRYLDSLGTALLLDALERAADQQAPFLIANSVLTADTFSDEAPFTRYKEQLSVERGLRFLKDPLFLASSVFVKKPGHFIALSFIRILCLLIYRLAEHRLPQHLQQNERTIPNQVNKPLAKPTMCWVFQGFELLRPQTLHHAIRRLLAPLPIFYFLSS